MAVTASPYGAAFNLWLTGSLPWTGGSVMVALTGSEYTPDIDTHDFFNDVTGECVGQGGYTAGGALLANSSSTFTAATNVLKLDGDDTTWTNSTIQARYAVVYYAKTAGSASSPLVGVVDFGATMSTNNGTFQITWASGGIVTMTGT